MCHHVSWKFSPANISGNTRKSRQIVGTRVGDTPADRIEALVMPRRHAYAGEWTASVVGCHVQSRATRIFTNNSHKFHKDDYLHYNSIVLQQFSIDFQSFYNYYSLFQELVTAVLITRATASNKVNELKSSIREVVNWEKNV